MTLPDGLQLPNENERRQIFYWLNRISSYTAWNRILGYYRVWTKTSEASVREASNRGWLVQYDATGEAVAGVPDSRGGGYPKFKGSAIGESALIRILKDFAHYEKGATRLLNGDKRVFRYDAHGEFVMGSRTPGYWGEMLHRIDIGESGINEEYTPLWEAFKATFYQFALANGECWPHVIQDRYIDRPAPVTFDDPLRNDLTKMTFPDALPEIPEPKEILLVPTGKEIPYSGIWEPIDAPVKKGFSLFRSEPGPKGPFALAGCMNYLHGGSPAPQASVQIGSHRSNVDTTWRLLWRDDRYEDGTIPTEESDYVFLQPENPVATPASLPSGEAILWAESGQPAPKTGRWLVETDLQASIDIQAGEILPQHNERHVRWVLAES